MSKNTQQHKVSGVPKKMNVIDYCVKNLPILGSKTAVKKAIQRNKLTVNRKIVAFNFQVKNGDNIYLQSTENQLNKQLKSENDLPIVFEDNYLIIINKPGGIAVNGNRNKTVENAVKKIAKKSPETDALPFPIPVHRLDVPTRGLVMLAKTKTALIRLNKAFQLGKIDKTYYAVVHGKTPKTGEIKTPIEGKKCHTQFENMETVPSRIFGHFSLLKFKLLTGRTHQLRIHSKRISHLIVGDKLYAEKQQTLLGKGLFLCACQLRFEHPITAKKMRIELPIPNKFRRLLEKERERF